MNLKKENELQSVPVFVEIGYDYPGGGTLDKTGFTDGEILKAGSLVKFDESTRLVTILKTAKIVENAAGGATSYKISKGSKLVVTDAVAAVVGGLSYAITAINTSNADYDTITVGTSLGALNAGDVIFNSATTGPTAGALKVKVNGILRNDVEVKSNVTLMPVVQTGKVYNRRLPHPAPQAVKDDLKGLIIFSEQF